jgi:hypothetical protein
MRHEQAQLARHDDALLCEAAHRLVDTVAPYGVLTRRDLETLSGAEDWRSVAFEHALQRAIEDGALVRLSGDLYEIPASEGAPPTSSSGRHGVPGSPSTASQPRSAATARAVSTNALTAGEDPVGHTRDHAK